MPHLHQAHGMADPKMDHHAISVVRVDLHRTRALYEAGASSGSKLDTRPILYTADVTSRHRYVRIQRQDMPNLVAYGELRSSPIGGNWMSMGLIAALGMAASADESGVVELIVSQSEERVDKSKCSCSLPSIASCEVLFTSRPRPQRAVAGGLERILPSLLLREVIWTGRKKIFSGFNREDLIEFGNIQVEAIGTGCCSALATFTNNTRIKIAFAGEGDDTSREENSVQVVDHYVNLVAQKLGGVSHHAEKLVQAICTRLKQNQTNGEARGALVGAIVSGVPGVGKTALVKAVCEVLNVHIRYLTAADVFQTYVGHSEAQIVKTFEELMQQAPSILVVDGLESVATTRGGFLDSESTLEVGVLGAFIACLNKLKTSHARVFVLGTTSHLDEIDAAIYSNSRMDLIVRIEPPSQQERVEILTTLLRNWSIHESKGNLVSALSDATGGFVGADLLSMCQKALQICINDQSVSVDRINPSVSKKHFDEALTTTYPSVLQAHHVSLRQQSSATPLQSDAFSGIYGVDDALQTIRVSLLQPLEDCSRFLQFGTVPPKGILFTGPPGSGKTHLANVVAAELRRRGLASFISVRCTDLLTKVVGDTEKALRGLFETARSAAPCVIYFDQIESIAPVRGFDTSTEQTFDRLLSMLLVEMDGFSTSRESIRGSQSSGDARNAFLKQHVVILASTHEKNQLDPAILRPGRFDVHIQLDLPDRDARLQMFRDSLQGVPVDYSSDSELSSPNSLSAFVADQAEGFSAGDLASLLREAAMASMRESLDATSVPIRFIRDALQQHLTRHSCYQK